MMKWDDHAAAGPGRRHLWYHSDEDEDNGDAVSTPTATSRSRSRSPHRYHGSDGSSSGSSSSSSNDTTILNWCGQFCERHHMRENSLDWRVEPFDDDEAVSSSSKTVPYGPAVPRDSPTVDDDDNDDNDVNDDNDAGEEEDGEAVAAGADGLRHVEATSPWLATCPVLIARHVRAAYVRQEHHAAVLREIDALVAFEDDQRRDAYHDENPYDVGDSNDDDREDHAYDENDEDHAEYDLDEDAADGDVHQDVTSVSSLAPDLTAAAKEQPSVADRQMPDAAEASAHVVTSLADAAPPAPEPEPTPVSQLPAAGKSSPRAASTADGAFTAALTAVATCARALGPPPAATDDADHAAEAATWRQPLHAALDALHAIDTQWTPPAQAYAGLGKRSRDPGDDISADCTSAAGEHLAAAAAAADTAAPDALDSSESEGVVAPGVVMALRWSRFVASCGAGVPAGRPSRTGCSGILKILSFCLIVSSAIAGTAIDIADSDAALVAVLRHAAAGPPAPSSRGSSAANESRLLLSAATTVAPAGPQGGTMDGFRVPGWIAATVGRRSESVAGSCLSAGTGVGTGVGAGDRSEDCSEDSPEVGSEVGSEVGCGGGGSASCGSDEDAGGIVCTGWGAWASSRTDPGSEDGTGAADVASPRVTSAHSVDAGSGLAVTPSGMGAATATIDALCSGASGAGASQAGISEAAGAVEASVTSFVVDSALATSVAEASGDAWILVAIAVAGAAASVLAVAVTVAAAMTVAALAAESGSDGGDDEAAGFVQPAGAAAAPDATFMDCAEPRTTERCDFGGLQGPREVGTGGFAHEHGLEFVDEAAGGVAGRPARDLGAGVRTHEGQCVVDMHARGSPAAADEADSGDRGARDRAGIDLLAFGGDLARDRLLEPDEMLDA
ncbi:hypothetical protein CAUPRSCDRAFT_10463 [Caulochytrium protostelioides]|uniref:Uncharacterized protein n=1 Tax=Caulochytrium protostelioides TaxID=1555241 RepID=A0A4P9WZW1_9FUNG|nr:hypothetical protein CAUPRSCDRAFT_10463 [Caulochytrium protostelioides]